MAVAAAKTGRSYLRTLGDVKDFAIYESEGERRATAMTSPERKLLLSWFGFGLANRVAGSKQAGVHCPNSGDVYKPKFFADSVDA